MSAREVLIIGCGYIGARVAALEMAEGAHVRALARSHEAAARLSALGIRPVAGDLDRPESLRDLSVANAELYYFAPPPSHGSTDSRMEAFSAAVLPPGLPKRAVLISTTGVYGDCHGEWVTEERPPNPQAERARRRYAAEQTLRRFGEIHGIPVVILRVAGIYGPGRLPEERLRAREPVLREAESPWSNRIHADDLARACVAAMRRGRAGAVYNATDGHPTTMTDFFNRAADALGLPRPEQLSMSEARGRLSAGMLSYLAESKRLDNRRLREELGVEILYPDLASGLAASVGHGPFPGNSMTEGR
jgi:nucleoside-diphosphate-sugar epimerase